MIKEIRVSDLVAGQFFRPAANVFARVVSVKNFEDVATIVTFLASGDVETDEFFFDQDEFVQVI